MNVPGAPRLPIWTLGLALGGALAAMYYVEPFATYDADIFFIPADKGLTAGIPAIYAHLQAQGWRVEREHLLVRGFPVQFLAAQGFASVSNLAGGILAWSRDLDPRIPQY